MYRRRYRVLLEHACCIAALVALPALRLLPGAGAGELPLDLSAPLFMPPWEEARPEGVTPESGPLATLEATRYYPWFAFMNECGLEERSILWNPYEGCGTPFMAVWRTRALSPFSLPFYLMPIVPAFAWSFLLKLAVAGICAFYAARRFGFPAPVALVAGITYQMAGPGLAAAALPLSDVAVWLPLLLVTAERIALGLPRAWALGTIPVGLMAAGGDPETLATALLMSLAYLVVRKSSVGGGWLPSLGRFGLTAGVGIGLAGAQLAPYLEFLSEAAPGAHDIPRLSLGFESLGALLFPGALAQTQPDHGLPGILLHGGTAALLLLALWVALRPFANVAQRKRVDGLLGVAGLFTVVAFVVPWLPADTPVLGALTPMHFLIGNALALGLMAAAALEDWILLDADQAREALGRLFVRIPLVWGLLGGISLSAAWPLLDSGGSAGQAGLLGASAVLLLILLGITLLKPDLRVVGYGAAVIAMVTAWNALHAALPSTPAAEAFPETAFVGSLRQQGGRVSGSEALREWPLAANGVAQVYCPSGIRLARYRAFMDTTRRDPLLLRRAGSRSLLLTRDDIQGDFAPIRPVLNIAEVFPSGAVLFKDLDAKPRAWVAYAGRPVDRFDPGLLRSDKPPLIEGAKLPEVDSGPEAAATVLETDLHARVTVQVGRTRPGVLVLADAWYPGWQASVNGAPAEIVPVDGMFRGVELSEGEHEVAFVYRPASLSAGLLLSGCSLLMVLFGLRGAIFRRRG